MSDGTLRLDRLDWQVLHALRLDPRAPFRRIAAVLGSSEQTVARRYRRLREGGAVRVIAARPHDARVPRWQVRIRVAPAAALAVAEALARRDDVSWVTLMEGGAEVTCTVRPRSSATRDELLLQRLPRTAEVTGVTAASVLHAFGSGPSAEWHDFDHPLDDDQIAALLPAWAATTVAVADPLAPEPLDAALERVLADDGRASYAQLASATGASESRVARRLEALRASRSVAFEAELPPTALGFPTQAALWITVAPGALEAVGEAIAALPEVAFAGAMSGTANLLAHVVCRDGEAVYRLLNGPIGALEGVRAVETTIAARRIKQEGTMLDGPRLRFSVV